MFPRKPRAVSGVSVTSESFAHETKAAAANLSPEVRSALIHFLVYSLGGLFLLVGYFNYVLLKPYYLPIFWATVISIPLHTLKRYILRFAYDTLQHDDVTLPGLFWLACKVMVKLILGPVWSVTASLLCGYNHMLKSSVRNVHVNQRPQSSADSLKEVAETELDESVETSREKALQILYDDIQNLRRRLPKSFRDPHRSNSRSEKTETTKPRSISISSLSSTIVSELHVSTSTLYFGYLLRACFAFLVYKFTRQLSSWHYLVLAMTILALFFVHFVVITVHAIITTRHDHVPILSRFVNILRLDTILSLLRYGYHRTRLYFRYQLISNLNTLTTIFLIASFLTLIASISSIFLFKIGQELNTVVDVSLENLEKSGWNTGKMEAIRNVVETGRVYAISWGDEKLKTNFPGANLTSQQVYDHIAMLIQKVRGDNKRAIGSMSKENLLKNFENVYPTLYSAYETYILGNPATQTLALDMGFAKNLAQEASQIVSDVLKNIKKIPAMTYLDTELLSRVGTSVAVWAMGAFTLISDGFNYAFNWTISFLMFFATLYYLVLSERSIMEYMARCVVLVDPGNALKYSIERSIQAIFVSTLKMASFHSLFTWLTFSLFQCEFVYIASFAAAVLGAVPIVNPLYVVILGLVPLIFVHGAYWSALSLGLSHLSMIWVVDTQIYSEIPDSHPYVAGYSIILGLWAFGWEGVILGPVLACFPSIIYHFLQKNRDLIQ